MNKHKNRKDLIVWFLHWCRVLKSLREKEKTQTHYLRILWWLMKIKTNQRNKWDHSLKEKLWQVSKIFKVQNRNKLFLKNAHHVCS